MSNRFVLGAAVAILIVILAAILIVLVGIYQQNSQPQVLVTATAIPTETLDPTVAVKATVFVSCFNAYIMDATKASQCMDTGGFVNGESTRIP